MRGGQGRGGVVFLPFLASLTYFLPVIHSLGQIEREPFRALDCLTFGLRRRPSHPGLEVLARPPESYEFEALRRFTHTRCTKRGIRLDLAMPVL